MRRKAYKSLRMLCFYACQSDSPALHARFRHSESPLYDLPTVKRPFC